MTIDTPKISRLNGRFETPSLEIDYLEDSWPGLRLQTALTLIGFSAAWLLSLATDFAYLTGSEHFIPVAGMRTLVGVFGVSVGAWMIWARPRREDWLCPSLVNLWIGLSILTAGIVASRYPLNEPNPAETSDILVFTSFWMSIQVLGLGVALSSWIRGVWVLAASYVLTYTALAIYWSPQLPDPLIGASILVLTASIFSVILAILFSHRARRRFYLTRLYEEARDAAERSREFSTFLLAATGHDIRQPVYALDLNAETLEEHIEAQNWEKARAGARQQRQVIRNISRMLSSVLELAYLDVEQRKASGSRLVVADLFRDLIPSFEEAADLRGIDLRCVGSQLAINADSGIVEHILSNLMANAIHHSGGRRVLLGARRRGGELLLVVADDGSGLGSDALRVTGEDMRAQSAAMPRLRSGLGLEISFKLADHGGLDLQIWSKPGKGVCATLSCPISS